MERNTDNSTEQTFPLQTFDEQKVALPNFLPGDLQRLDKKGEIHDSESKHNW